MMILALTGGSSRSDVQSLAFLLPCSIVVCAIGLSTLEFSHLKDHRYALVGYAAVFLLAFMHLIPLPPEIWGAQPGRALILEITDSSGLQDQWRPLSVSPMESWVSISFIVPALAVFILGVQLKTPDLDRLIPLIIGLGALSGLLGLMQIVGGGGSAYHLYNITNNNNAVGLFANRNHAALFLACLLPLLAVFSIQSASKGRGAKSSAVIPVCIAIVIVPLVLVTGSRSGVITTVMGFIGAAAIYLSHTNSMPNRSKKAAKSAFPLTMVFLIISLTFITLVFSRAEAIERLMFQDAADDQRSLFWVASIRYLFDYWPWGSGASSFATVYEQHEPRSLLDSTYLNNAHNDYLEIPLSFGIGGTILLATGVVGLAWRSFDIWFRYDGQSISVSMARMGGCLIFMIAAASVVDYPMRTPFLLSVFALILLWFSRTSSQPSRAKPVSDLES